MKIEEQRIFPPRPVRLRDGRAALVRFLRETDGEMLAGLYASVPPGDNRFYCPHPLDREHALGNAARAGDPGETVLVAEITGPALAGYAWVRRVADNPDRGHFGICVSPACQGSGAGRALMERLFEIVERLGPPVIALNVQEANAKAVALYRKLGFRVVGKRVRPAIPSLNCPAEPEYLMEWRSGRFAKGEK